MTWSFTKNLHLFNVSVYADGRVCISILHAPGDDPMGYESSAERWSPVQSVEKILLSVVSMLAGKYGQIYYLMETTLNWAQNILNSWNENENSFHFFFTNLKLDFKIGSS